MGIHWPMRCEWVRRRTPQQRRTIPTRRPKAGETVLTFRANDGTGIQHGNVYCHADGAGAGGRDNAGYGAISRQKAQKQSATAQSLGDIPSGETSRLDRYTSALDRSQIDDPDADPGPRGIMAEGWVDLYRPTI